MKNLIKFIASFFYVGYSPLIPGTSASLVSLMLYFLFRGNIYLYSGLLMGVSALGFLCCGRAEEIFQERDARRIVIDEAAGLLLAFWALPLQLDLVLVWIGFFIFRALDAVKVYPANELERLEGSRGVMGDDLVAGLYTNISLQLVTRVLMRI